MSPADVWAGDLTAGVDGAGDGGRGRVGVLVPFLGVRVFRPLFRSFALQQTMESHAISSAVRLPIRLGRSCYGIQ